MSYYTFELFANFILILSISIWFIFFGIGFSKLYSYISRKRNNKKIRKLEDDFKKQIENSLNRYLKEKYGVKE